jgi:hypothetical protein
LRYPLLIYRENFGKIFASIFPLYYTNREQQANDLCEKFLAKFFSSDDYNKLIMKELDVILIELLNEISFEKSPVPPAYSPDAVMKLMEHLANSWSVSVVDLLYKSR